MKNLRNIIVLFALIFNCNNYCNSGITAEETEETWTYGYKNFTRYQNGKINIILTNPHGGQLLPAGLPQRPQFGCYQNGKCLYEHGCGNGSLQCKVVLNNDFNTQELTLIIAEKIRNLTGLIPHIVINELSRKIFDANRDKPEATFGHVDVGKAWHDFTNFIKIAKKEMNNSGGGLLIDVHGLSSHPEKWIELGYGVFGNLLDQKEVDPNISTIRHLANITKANYSFNNILRGEESWGGRLEKLGYKVVPSIKYPGPNGGGYARGGFIVRTYGSSDGKGNVDAIQIESPAHLRSPDILEKYGGDLGLTIYQFHKKFYPSQKRQVEKINNIGIRINGGKSISIVIPSLLVYLRHLARPPPTLSS